MRDADLNAVFEDLIADFIVENRREPDIEEMAYLARSIRRFYAQEFDF